MTKSMSRRAHLTHVFPSFQLGGVPIRISSVINHFGDRFRHSVIALDGSTGCGGRINPALDVDYPEAGPQSGPLLRRIRDARRALTKLNPDLLLTYNWGSIEWALSYVRKLVTELSGGVFGYLDSVLERHSFDEFGELI